MGVWKDLLGTVRSSFQLGIGGARVKNNAGVVEARNPADSAYAAVAALLFQTFGDDFELNAGAAGSGADWVFTFRRPSTGMTHNLIVVMPSGDPAVGQALTVASFAGDVITLEWTTVAGGTDKVVVDTTTVGFGASSPVAMFTKPADAVVLFEKVIIDTAFDGTPTLSIGITGSTSKYMPSTAIDLNAAANTVFDYEPGLPAEVGTEAMIATYSAGGASVGSARILTAYVIPS